MSKQIDKLTPEQEAKVPYYLDKYLAIGTNTDPCDRAKAEDAVRRSYAYLKLPAITKFIWLDNPFDGAVEAAKLANGTDTPTKAQISDQASKASYGSLEAYWVAFYDFIASELPVPHDPLIDIAKDIVLHCGVYWTFEGVVVMTEKPKAIHMITDKDNQKKLHNLNGPALEYRDGRGIFAVNGVAYNSLMEVAMEGKLGKETTA
jgi:hypothetical protein